MAHKEGVGAAATGMYQQINKSNKSFAKRFVGMNTFTRIKSFTWKYGEHFFSVRQACEQLEEIHLGLEAMKFLPCLSWPGNLRQWQALSKLSPRAVALGVKGGDEYEDPQLEGNAWFRKQWESNNLSEDLEFLFLSSAMCGLTADV